MKRVTLEAIAFSAIAISIVLISISSLSGKWFSTCVPLSTILIKAKEIENVYGSQSINLNSKLPEEKIVKNKLNEKLEAYQHLIPTDSKMSLNEKEKIEILNTLSSSSVCASKGFFKHCVYGNSFFTLGSYTICLSHAEQISDLSWQERIALFSIFISLISASISLLLIIIHWSDWIQTFPRIFTFFKCTIPLLIFISGLTIFIGLFSTIVKALEFSDDKTSFYNDLLKRVFKDYARIGLVNWHRMKGIPEVEVWGRNLISHMRYFGLGSDFYMALTSAVLLWLACAALLFRPNVFSPPYDARYNGKHC